MLEERKNAGECNICSCIDFYDPQLDFIPHSSKAIYPSIVPYTNEAHLSFLCVLKIHPLDIYTSFSLRAPSLARDETSSTHAIVSSCNSCPLHFSVEKKGTTPNGEISFLTCLYRGSTHGKISRKKVIYKIVNISDK